MGGGRGEGATHTVVKLPTTFHQHVMFAFLGLVMLSRGFLRFWFLKWSFPPPAQLMVTQAPLWIQLWGLLRKVAPKWPI